MQAVITKIESVDRLHIVTFDFEGQALTMMSLGLDKNLTKGAKVLLSVKPTHIAIAKSKSLLLSCENQIDAKVCRCEDGLLLSTVTLGINKQHIEVIITRQSAQSMQLKKEDRVVMLIQASVLSILKVLKC